MQGKFKFFNKPGGKSWITNRKISRICFTFDSIFTSARDSVAEQVEKLRINIAAAGEQLTRSESEVLAAAFLSDIYVKFESNPKCLESEQDQ